jgi:protein SCO1/2
VTIALLPGRAAALAALLALAAAAAEGQFMTGKRVERDRLAAETATPARQLVERVGFDQKLGGELPLDLGFRDDTGRELRLGELFAAGRPVVLGLVYYRCPVLCTLVERGLASGLKPLDLEPGRDFEVVFVSIDPTDTPETAAGRRSDVLAHYGRDSAAAGWHFLVGDEASIARLADAVGFRYALDPGTGQYAHAAGLAVATPDGVLSRYLYGVDYAPRDLKLALVESSRGEIGTVLDKALLVCFRYDAALGKYTAATMTVLRIGATLTVLALGAFLFFALRRERRDRRLPAGGLA